MNSVQPLTPASTKKTHDFIYAMAKLELDLPLPQAEKAMFLLSERLKATLKDFQSSLTTRLNDAFEATKLFTEEKIEALKKKAAEVQSSTFWQTLQALASFIMGALTFFTGIALYAYAVGAAVTVAVSLVAVGIVSMTNLLIEHLGGWEWLLDKLGVEDVKKRDYLRLLFPLLLTLLSLSLGWSMGPHIWNQLDGTAKTLAFLSFLAQIGVVSTGFMENVSKSKVTFSQVDLIKIEKEMDLEQQKVQTITKIIEVLQKIFSQFQRGLGSLVRKRNEMMEMIAGRQN